MFTFSDTQKSCRKQRFKYLRGNLYIWPQDHHPPIGSLYSEGEIRKDQLEKNTVLLEMSPNIRNKGSDLTILRQFPSIAFLSQPNKKGSREDVKLKNSRRSITRALPAAKKRHEIEATKQSERIAVDDVIEGNQMNQWELYLAVT